MEGFPITVRLPVQWGDMDALGHVNNARYFTWFETARMALFERIGLASQGTPEVGPILAHTRCDFLAPVHYPAEVVVSTRVARLGRSSFTMDYVAALASSPHRPVARAEAVIVLVDYRTGAPIPIPGGLRSALGTMS